jgi:tetratricopeptide (TPR) repeat protein
MPGDRSARSEGKPSRGRSDRSGRPATTGSRRTSSSPGGSRARSSSGPHGPSRGRDSRPRPPRDDTPPIPEEITGEELDRGTLAELRTLPEGMREDVARLLVATEACLDEDPALALRFALAAKKKASRVAMVREAVALAAYAQGDYAQALAEFRAVRRMTGDDEHIAAMADCERALGKPRKALDLLASVSESTLSAAARVEARLVAAGARRDLGQPEAALVILGIPELTASSTEEHVGRLRYTYADVLVELGRAEEALTWFERAGETEADLDTDERIANVRADTAG